jgi:ABC-type transport system substrate-binding protein
VTGAAFAAVLLVTLAPAARVAPARHPAYGGTLRVEIGATVASIDPGATTANAEEAAAKREIESLLYEQVDADGSVSGAVGSGPFRISEWQPGKHLALAANEDCAGGRPFVDAIEIEMGRAARDRLLDLALARADFAEVPPEDARQAAARGIRITASQPDELIALVFPPRRAAVDDARVREAVAHSIDRLAIVEFILQKEGEAAGGLLPQWLSGTAFLFPTIADFARAKELRAQMVASPQIRLGYDSDDALEQSIAERIVVDARESGIAVTAASAGAGTVAGVAAGRSDGILVRLAMHSAHSALALADSLGSLGPLAGVDAAPLPEAASPEQIYERELAAVAGFRVIPLVWVPRVYGVSERVRDWQVPATGESWPLADVWLDAQSVPAASAAPAPMGK